MPDETSPAVALIVGLLGGGGLASVIVALLSRRRVRAEVRLVDAQTEKTTADAASVLYEVMGKLVERLNAELAQAKVNAERDRQRIRELEEFREEALPKLAEREQWEKLIKAGRAEE